MMTIPTPLKPKEEKCMMILDRFEGKFAVLEDDGVMKNVPRNLLPKNIREGDVVVKNGGEYLLDEKNTAARRKKIAELQNGLFED